MSLRTSPNSDVEIKLRSLKERIERAKIARIQAEERKAAAERRLREIEEQIRALGVDPDRVEGEIERLERETTEKMARAEELLRPFEELMRNGGLRITA